MQTNVQVTDQLGSAELFDAFKVQLAKDFQQSNFSITFIDALQPNYTFIHEKIVEELHRAERKADARLMQLINRIDISEAQLKRYLHNQSHQKQRITIAELIIKRVLQKVVIKQYYKLSSDK